MNRRDAIKRTILLTGYAMSASSIAAVMQGCKADQAPDWQPAFLSADEAGLVADIAETILPRTDDSPGARDVLVHRFIDRMLAEYTPAEARDLFRKGLGEFTKRCADANGGAAFAKLDDARRLAYLNQVNQEAILEEEKRETPAPPDQTPFFLNLKQAVLAAYFTSEEVGTKVLAYDPIPGEWRGCAPLEEVSGGKVWALS